MKRSYQRGMVATTMAVLLGNSLTGMAAHVTELDPIFVSGNKEKELLGGEYATTELKMGLLGTKEVMNVPFSQINLTRKSLDTFGDPSQPSVSSLVNVPSIRTVGSTMYNDFSIRGQAANSYQIRVNGIPSVFSQMNVGIDFIERIDVTSGPAMGLNGVGGKESPGGIVNFVSKKAGYQSGGDIKWKFSGRGSWGIGIDAQQRFGEKKEWGIRLNTEYINGETGIVNDKLKNQDIYLNIDHQSDKSYTNILLGYRDTLTQGGQRYFYFGDATLRKVPKAPNASRNYSFKGQQLGMRTTLALLNHEYRFTQRLTAFINAGYSLNNGYSYVMTQSSRLHILNDEGDFKRALLNEPYKIENKYLQMGLRGDLQSGKVKHHWALAWDRDWYNDFWGATVTPRESVSGNIYTGIFDITGTPVNKIAKQPSGRNVFTGFRFVDTLSFDKYEFMIGIQHHEAKILSVSSKQLVKSSAVSPLFGIVYRPNRNVALYASHSESFDKGTLVTNSAYKNRFSILPPTKMKANEVGVKYMKNEKLWNVAYFDMNQASNIDVTVGMDTYLRTDGRNNFRGIEASINGKINDKWSILGGFMYMNARYKKTKSGINDNKKIIGVSDWSGVLGTEYHANDKLDIIGRLVYTGSAPVKDRTSTYHRIPSSLVADLGMRYRFTVVNVPVTLNAMIYNLFNKNYWLPRPTYDMGVLANPRTFSLTATMHF